uniref:Tetratricopeptide repeat protein n=1 Tax=candidate division WOR-3 bacterium TaxID=2052148 RepID=A0A7C4UGH2_UNCW3
MKKIIFFIPVIILFAIFGCSKKQITPGGLMDTPEAHYAEGKRLLKLERYDDAFIEFQRAVTLNKKFAPGYEGLGLVWLAKGDLKRAEENINKCLDLDGKFVPGLIAKGRLLIAKKDPEGSLKWFDNAIKLDPKNEDAYIYKADAYVLLQKYDEAEKVFSAGMQQLPNSQELNARWEMMQAARRAAAGLPPQYLAIARSNAITRADLAALLVVELDLDKITKEPGPTPEKKFAPPPTQQVMGKPETPKGLELPPDVQMHWAKSFISKVIELGIMEPYPDGNFDPQRPITRADFAMAVQNLLKGLLKDPGLSTRFIGSTSPFPDVPSSHYAFNAVMVVTTRGIMKAKLDGTFGLTDKVSGTDALLIIKQVKGNL